MEWRALGGKVLAVNAAEANPFIYHQDGHRTDGRVIRLGTGSRDVAVGPVSAPEAHVANPPGGAGALVEGNTQDALCDPLCVEGT